ncbi:hypothetical protein MPDQ_003434 [Monascus purpureus]|uniref:Uncharacterized protein n=1 Tax=Monascus purpureus TaxID=5098 RepID=A0A507QMV2_MONPU|nr:hypothetical protein MPDQ_003434 [Monascus purpureus]
MRRQPFFSRHVALVSLWVGIVVASNMTIVSWDRLRANIIRDTIYLDGGDDNTGVAYKLYLNESFNANGNTTTLFHTFSKTDGGAANNIAPRYVDGAMLANDDMFILYGGITFDTARQDLPSDSEVLSYEVYQQFEGKDWSQGVRSISLGSNVTSSVTDGAGVSAPSENLGFYFSGMRAPDWGPVNTYDNPTVIANTLITVDMSLMKPQWSNDTLPSNISGRVNGELVWLPVSNSGVLLAIGGVYNATVLSADSTIPSNVSYIDDVSPTYMESIPVYDVGSKNWYLQNTTGDTPPQLAFFCSVVAPAADRSSFNIYIYGGYDGVNVSETPSDDVYILSVPSFTWVKAYSGDGAVHGRSGHKCTKVYPDQMFVLGGSYAGNPEQELGGSILQVFNLNTLRFQDTYDPTSYSDYEVPSLVTAQIGGNGKGSATKTAPASWDDDALSQVFSTKYTGSITTYYPYIATKTPSKGKGGFPGWAGAIIGVVLGVLLIVGLVLAWWFLYRRRKNRKANTAATKTEVAGGPGAPGWIVNWMSKTPPGGPGHPSISQESASQVQGDEHMSQTHHSSISPLTPGAPSSTGVGSSGMQEADGSAVHELDTDNPPPVPGRFEMETEFNVVRTNPDSDDHRPGSATNEPRSLDAMLSSPSTERSPGGFSDASSSDSPPTRYPYHGRHYSDVSSPLSELSEISEGSSSGPGRPRDVSDVSYASPLSPSPGFPRVDEERGS